MELLLDSHPILWSIYEPDRLSIRVASLIADRQNRLFVSLGSIMEILHKAAFYKLPLVGPNVRPLLQQLEEFGCTILPILESDVLAAAALPLIHGDPFDRLYVAQSRSRSLTLATKDVHTARYGVPTIWETSDRTVRVRPVLLAYPRQISNVQFTRARRSRSPSPAGSHRCDRSRGARTRTNADGRRTRRNGRRVTWRHGQGRFARKPETTATTAG